jgi:hypothetical protein
MAEVDAGASAPVVPVANAPAADAVPAPDAPTVTDQAEPTQAEPVQPTRTYSEEEMRKTVSDRLAKERKRLAREARAEVEASFYKQQLEAAKAQPAQDQPKGKPQYKDFEGRPEEFVEALAAWTLEQREAARAKETEAQRAKHSEREEATYYETKLAEGSEKFPDLGDRLRSEEVALTRPMLDFVTDAEHGFAVGDYLANNAAESHKIAALSPVKQVLELHKIAQRLSAPPEITKTPPPIKPSGATSAVEKPWDELTQAEFNERRRRQTAQLHR